jgi:hypothetical protein
VKKQLQDEDNPTHMKEKERALVVKSDEEAVGDNSERMST